MSRVVFAFFRMISKVYFRDPLFSLVALIKSFIFLFFLSYAINVLDIRQIHPWLYSIYQEIPIKLTKGYAIFSGFISR
mgnify:CR=1 FL=1